MKLAPAPGKQRFNYAGKRIHHALAGVRDFIGVDGEGVTLPTGEHRYVLLGVGDEQIDNPDGLYWREIFEFLYEHYEPKRAMCGFYLGYDFTQWLKSAPEERIRRLLTIDGRESRRSKSPALRGKFLPVDMDGWQVDMLGSKRMMIRPAACDCLTVKCPHKGHPWLHINDAGPFFQTSFLNVIDPENWDHPILSDEEYETIRRGKEARETAVLDRDMRRYNVLENDVLARVLRDLAGGFRKLEVTLTSSQWYGPGQAAQAWMKGRAPKASDLTDVIPQYFLDAARCSYFGGWFEQQAHGPIPGESHEYDINSAYPHVISRMPCLQHGTYTRGVGLPDTAPGDLCLVRALAWTRPPRGDKRRGEGIGAMLHRDNEGRISRPLVTAGWYWLHELQAAQRAKCVAKVTPDRIYEWVNYHPCDCPPPLRRIANLYQLRLDVGKKTSLGKAAKLVANSLYGKFAQSVGMPQYGNPVYASLITAGCRTMILDAIASHPGGKRNVVMVATDAVFFLDPHPALPVSKVLGEWDYVARTNLCLFKPGVYWDDDARARLANNEAPQFKARGVSARDFAGQIARIDSLFAAWGDNPPPINADVHTPEEREAQGLPVWPKVGFTAGFAMTTCLQALVRNEWHTAGAVDQAKPLVQNANPRDKRTRVWLDPNAGRPIYRSEPWLTGGNAVYRHAQNYESWDSIPEDRFDSVPYEKRFGLEDPFSDESKQAFGVSPDEHEPMRGAFRFLTGQE